MSADRTEYSSTYFVFDRNSKEELRRLTIQDQMITTEMGGVLPEQLNPADFHRMLDIGCGTGGWLIEAAKAYPEMELIGIDVSRPMIQYARAQAQAQQVSERIEFAIMDALLILELPANFFDLVNMRLGISFLRTWEWHKLVSEMLRVSRPDGVIRVTECENGVWSSSQALMRIFEMSACAMYRSGHLFHNQADGFTAHLPELLTQYGVQHVQTRHITLQYQAGTPKGQAFLEDMRHIFQTGRPFLKKWGCLTQDYDALCLQAISEMQQPDFVVKWNFLTAWGYAPKEKPERVRD